MRVIMSISDITKAQKYASIAEVAAAQAKIYAEKLENAPDYAAQAEAAAEQASDSAQSALAAQNGANSSAGQASASANQAVQAAADAEGAAEAVFGSSLHAPTGEVLSTLPAAAGRVNTVPVFDGDGDAAVKDIADFAILDSNGKIPVSMIPAVALSEVFVVNSQAAMLALDAQEGDVAKRTDLGYSFILASEPASTLSNWVQVSDDVLAQLGLSTGATEVGAVDDDNNSTTVQGALALKASKAYLSATTGAAMIGALDSGGNATTVQEQLFSLSENIESWPSLDVIYGVTFKSNSDPSLQFAVSTNGINFTSPFTPQFYGQDSQLNDYLLKGRDPSIIFYKGLFYVGCTGRQAGSYDFIVFKSKDLMSWERVNCRLGPTAITGTTLPGYTQQSDAIWAPEFIEYNNELYVAISIQVDPNYTDKNSNSVFGFRPFWTKCIDIDNLTFTTPTEISLPSLTTRIDPDIAYDEKISKYVMAIKNEVQKTIECYQSNNIWGPYTSLATSAFSFDAEAPSIVIMPTGATRIYADPYTSVSGLVFTETLDYVTFTSPQHINTYPSRHGTFRRTTSSRDEAKCLLAISAISPDEAYQKSFVLSSGSQTITPVEGALYYVNGSVQATVSLAIGGAKRFFMSIRSASAEAGITISNLAGGARVIGFGSGIDQMYEVILDPVSNAYRMVSEKQIPNIINLVTDAGSQNINASTITWRPKEGWTYNVTGANTGTTVINSLPTQCPPGFTFYLRVDSTSNVNGLIRIKGGGSGINHSNDVLLDGSTGLDGKLVSLTKVGNGFSVGAF